MLHAMFNQILASESLVTARGTFVSAQLLAERSMLRDMGSGFRDRRELHWSDMVPWVLVIGAIVAVLALISRYLNGRDSRRLFNSPRGLFVALCRTHGLDRASCRLLQQLGRAKGLSQPAQLFLDPDAFLPEQLPAELQRHQEAIAALRERLFGQAWAEPKIDAAPAVNGAAVAAEELASIGAASGGGTTSGDLVTAGEILDEAEQQGASLAERHAVKALEALMRQINGNVAAGNVAPVESAHPVAQ